jgi:glucose/arabinose dehydrogenase
MIKIDFMKTLLVVLSGLFISTTFICFTLPSEDSFLNAKKNYDEYCAGCHGLELQKFVDEDWQYGKTPDALFITIKYGQEEIGMPDFNVTFTDQEIRDLSSYILAKGQKEGFSENIAGENVIHSEKLNFKIDTVITGLEIPWGMTWLPNGDMLIAERSGILYRFDGNNLYQISDVPKVYAFGQGGLLDIELHPEYSENGWLYITFSYYAGKTLADGGSTALMRAKLIDDKLIDSEILFKATPTEKRGQHFGSRIEFDKDGYLFLSVGDRGRMENAQLLTNYSGKIHRFNDDGSIPEDNPFVDVPGAIPSIWNYGHRNIQGLAINPETGDLWSHEHGPKGGDEVNIERKGLNYGWPEISYGINYNGTILTEYTEKEGMEQPLIYWDPSIAPCGMDFIEGEKYPQWKNNLIVGSLRFKYIIRCETDGNDIVHQEILLRDTDRVRNVKMGSDGYLYIAYETPGYIVRLMPQ